MVELPVHGDDLDVDMARSLLFRDHDVLVLFEESLDGVEDPDDPVSSDQGFVNLHPREWFALFSDVSA